MGVILSLAWEGAFCLSHPPTPTHTDLSIFFLTEWFCRAEIKRKFISICLPSDHWSQTSDNCVAALKLKEASRTGKEKREKEKSHGYTVIVRLWRRKLQCESTHRCFEGRVAEAVDCGLTWLLVCSTQKTPQRVPTHWRPLSSEVETASLCVTQLWLKVT